MIARRVGIPRPLHPVAWWLWAGGLAIAASRTTNPLLLVLILAVAGYVVVARRTDAPWARAFRTYLVLGLVVVVIRVVFRIALGGGDTSGHVVFTLPSVPTPGWMAGVRLGGAVTVESIVAAAYDGARLATILACVGAANALANPKRALASLPGALYELSVACVVALTIAPQLIESLQRVRRARRLRAAPARGLRAVPAFAAPVVYDALDRSVLLAAAMESRGYGRPAARVPRAAATAAVAGLASIATLSAGLYALLDPTIGAAAGPVLLAAGVVLAAIALRAGGQRALRTRYRADPWRGAEWLVSVSGAVPALVFLLGRGRGFVGPVTAWPVLPIGPLLAIGVAVVPAFVVARAAIVRSSATRAATSPIAAHEPVGVGS